MSRESVQEDLKNYNELVNFCNKLEKDGLYFYTYPDGTDFVLGNGKLVSATLRAYPPLRTINGEVVSYYCRFDVISDTGVTSMITDTIDFTVPPNSTFRRLKMEDIPVFLRKDIKGVLRRVLEKGELQ